MNRSLSRWSAVLLVAALVLAGCTGEDTATPSEPLVEVPDGWTTYEGDGFSFSHPPDWETRQEDDQRVDLAGPEGGDLAPLISVRVTDPAGLTAAESLDLVTANIVTQMPEAEPGEVESLEVAGSGDGAVTRVDYTQPMTTGDMPVREIQAVLLATGVEVVVRAVHRADEFEDVASTFDTMIRSLVLTGDPAADA